MDSPHFFLSLFYGQVFVIDGAVNDTPSIVPWAFSVYVAPLVTVLFFEIINEDEAVADHDAMRVFSFHSSSVALILEPNCVRVNLHIVNGILVMLRLQFMRFYL